MKLKLLSKQLSGGSTAAGGPAGPGGPVGSHSLRESEQIVRKLSSRLPTVHTV